MMKLKMTSSMMMQQQQPKRSFCPPPSQLLRQERLSISCIPPLQFTLPSPKTAIPSLQLGLDRVLFNPGVHMLKCPRTGLYNFSPSLENVTLPEQFNWKLLRPFVNAAQDSTLHAKGWEIGARLLTSTSSISGALSLMYFCVFGVDKGPQLDRLSMYFRDEPQSFTAISKAPMAFIVEPIGRAERVNEHLNENMNINMNSTKPNNKSVHSSNQKQNNNSRNSPNHSNRSHQMYAVVVEKIPDLAVEEDPSLREGTKETILMQMGNILERTLTTPPMEFEAFRLGTPQAAKAASSPKPNYPEAYSYCQLGSLLVRSQIDAADSRLPGRLFDIKTRACLPIRMNSSSWNAYSEYGLNYIHGLFNSYEREYYDMARSAFLKYNFQVALGGMDGIFVAFHNVSQLFGFQYISKEEMDSVLYGGGGGASGSTWFSMLLALYEQVMITILENLAFAGEKIRLSFELRQGGLEIWAERVPADGSFSPLTVPASLQQFKLEVNVVAVEGSFGSTSANNRASSSSQQQHRFSREKNHTGESLGSPSLTWRLIHQQPPSLGDYLAMKKRMFGIGGGGASGRQPFDAQGPFMRKIMSEVGIAGGQVRDGGDEEQSDKKIGKWAECD